MTGVGIYKMYFSKGNNKDWQTWDFWHLHITYDDQVVTCLDIELVSNLKFGSSMDQEDLNLELRSNMDQEDLYEEVESNTFGKMKLQAVQGGTEFTHAVAGQLLEYFQGHRKTFDFPYTAKGTDFQRRVWEALGQIPYGETRSYKDIAVAINKPKAFRAVGNTNNKNPMMIVVPCHRVVGSNGHMVGYRAGLSMKKLLLEHEKGLL